MWNVSGGKLVACRLCFVVSVKYVKVEQLNLVCTAHFVHGQRPTGCNLPGTLSRTAMEVRQHLP